MKLHLVLKTPWWSAVSCGNKNIEYRQNNEFWQKRIWSKREQFTDVVFHRGYTSDTMTFPIEKIDLGNCPIPNWKNGEYIRIHFKNERGE